MLILFVFILATPPEVIEKPQQWQKVAQGRQTNITCKTTGKPDPVITWFKNDQLLAGDKYHITDEGTLQISVGRSQLTLHTVTLSL